MPKRTASSAWISVDMEGIGGVATYSHMMRAVSYGARDYLEVYKAMLAMPRITASAVPPEQP